MYFLDCQAFSGVVSKWQKKNPENRLSITGPLNSGGIFQFFYSADCDDDKTLLPE